MMTKTICAMLVPMKGGLLGNIAPPVGRYPPGSRPECCRTEITVWSLCQFNTDYGIQSRLGGGVDTNLNTFFPSLPGKIPLSIIFSVYVNQHEDIGECFHISWQTRTDQRRQLTTILFTSLPELDHSWPAKRFDCEDLVEKHRNTKLSFGSLPFNFGLCAFLTFCQTVQTASIQ